VLPEKPVFTFRDAVAGLIAVMIVASLIYSATVDQSAAALTAIVGAAGGVTGYLFRGGNMATPNGTGSTNGSAGSGGGATTSATP